MNPNTQDLEYEIEEKNLSINIAATIQMNSKMSGLRLTINDQLSTFIMVDVWFSDNFDTVLSSYSFAHLTFQHSAFFSGRYLSQTSAAE